MRSFWSIGLAIILTATTFSQTASTKLSDLGWLAGCWEMRNEKRDLLITEMWMKPAGDAMLGVGRTLKAGKLVDYEFLRIVEDANGLSYISRPSANKDDTVFKMIRSSANEIVFENPTHDFPQRILYKRNGDKMTARIEGTANGKTRA
ncbi:MAG: DUF6265 family protein, partial [Acidobacteriota bacterium]